MPKKFSLEDKTVLLTGGSSGIGYELSRLFLKEGARLVMIAKNAAKLEAAAERLEKEYGQKPLCLSMDLSRPETPWEIFEEMRSKKIRVDVLVNNAGFGIYGEFYKNELEECLRMTDVNVKAVLSLTHLFLPAMVERGEGGILNVASTAAFQPVPLEAAYAATKSFVLSFSEALANELEGTGVRVSCLVPGPTDTAFFGETRVRASEHVKRAMMTSREVAEKGISAFKEGKVLAVAGFRNSTIPFLERFVPRSWVVKIARRMVE